MNFPFYVARRYLFSKKSHHTINIISGISVTGVAVATMALVCTLSVFNGFRDLVAQLFTSFDPQLEVVTATGVPVRADDPSLKAVREDADVAVVTECLADHALALYRGRQAVVTLKGVDDNFVRCTDLNDILYGDGSFTLRAADLSYAVPGIGVAVQLGCGYRFDGPITVCAPRKGERVNMANPAESFNVDELYSSGVVFSVRQRKYDDNLLLCPLSLAQRLFDRGGQITSLELRLADGADTESVKARLQRALGDRFRVLDRYDQQEDVFRIMNIEKAIAYIFLTFILLVACFNIIGSLSMLIIDKKDDVATLRHMGADDRLIERIFLFEGWLISTLGAVLGIVLGLALCLAQQYFGLLKLGESSGNFIIDAYPVSVRATDVVAVFVTVALVSFAAIWYPVRRLTRRLL